VITWHSFIVRSYVEFFYCCSVYLMAKQVCDDLFGIELFIVFVL